MWPMACLKSGTADVSHMKRFMCQKMWKQHLAGLRPKGSVKTKACSSSRLLFWVHMREAGSQALTAAPPPWGAAPMSVLSPDWLEGTLNQERLWHRVQDRDGKISIGHNVSLVETCWTSAQGYFSVLFTQQEETPLVYFTVIKWWKQLTRRNKS